MSRDQAAKQARERWRLTQIGEAIRSSRKTRRMTLGDLADAVGLSVTFLSRLERGQVACSIGNLLEIAGVLNLSPAALFSGADDPERSKAFRVVRARAPDPSAARKGGPYAWCQLASGIGEQRMEAFLLDLPTGVRNAPLVTHPGEEFCLVLSGAIEFQVGDEIVALAVGDSIHLRSDVPHMAWTRGRSPAQLLMVTAIESQSATAVEWWARLVGARRLPGDDPSPRASANPKRSKRSKPSKAVKSDVPEADRRRQE